MSSTDMPRPKPGVMDIAAYVPWRETAHGVAKVYKLSSNESPLGPSPKVAEALAAKNANLALYPDGSAHVLRDAISRTYGLNPDNIMCGNGSDELLGLLCQTYLAPGDEGLFTEHGFLVYKIQILAAGATPVSVPDTEDLTANVDNILGAVTERTKLVFLANPNNPTGTYLPVSEVRRLHAGLPGHVILVLDAAYAEYVRRNDYEAGIELVSANPNVVMTRTFSKIHGLAGLRIGWMYAHEAIIDACNRVRGPFNVNALAIRAVDESVYVGSVTSETNELVESFAVPDTDRLVVAGSHETSPVGGPRRRQDGRLGRIPFRDHATESCVEQNPSVRCRAFMLSSERNQDARLRAEW